MSLITVDYGAVTGGGSNIPFGIALDGTNGGVSYSTTSLASNAIAEITVTQKPKYIELIMISIDSAASGLSGTIDVENETAYRYGYWSGSMQNSVWSNWQTYFTSITPSKVVLKNNYGGACRTWVNCYY